MNELNEQTREQSVVPPAEENPADTLRPLEDTAPVILSAGNVPPKKKKRPAAMFSLLVVCCLLFSGIGAAAGYALAATALHPQKGTTQLHISTTPLVTSGGTAEALTGNEIYTLGCRQVVGISIPVTTTNVFGQTTSTAVAGSGFIISEGGYILTNYHVIEYADKYNYEINVMLHDGTLYSAALVGGEEENDVAVIKIEADGLSPATLGDSDQMQVGQPVYAIGNPLGELEYTMTGGIVSALDREIRTEEAVAINMFQIDAAVNSGNSGGPVYDAAGRVIGIVTAKYSESGVEGLGFAVPINDAVTIARQLMENGYVTGKAYLGVSVQDIDRRYAEYYNMPRGAYITGVEEDSCAQKAGLSAGDVITAVAGVQIVSTQELKAALRAHNAGETVELTVYRAGVQSAVQVILDEYIPRGNTVPPLQTR